MFNTRVVNWNGHPYGWGKTFGRYYMEWLTRFLAMGWIPFRFTDDALLNTPGLTEETLKEFFASNPPCCEPPGYEEYIASHGS